MDIKKELWVEKYRPSNIDEICLPKFIKNRFKGGEIDAHLLFGGSAGTGKTSLSHILTKGMTVLFLNGSDDRKIETVREKVISFCATKSILNKGKRKVVWFDEAEKLTKDAQEALKGVIEKYESNVLFLFTSNHPEKIIPELHSRFEYINFNISDEETILDLKKQYGLKIFDIVTKEGYKIDAQAGNYLLNEIFPDLRKITGLLYSCSRLIEKSQPITIDLLKTNMIKENVALYDFIINNYRDEEVYKYITSEFSGKEIDALKSLGEPFLKYLFETQHKDKILQTSLIVHKYNYEATTGDVDPLLPLLACCSALSQILK